MVLFISAGVPGMIFRPWTSNWPLKHVIFQAATLRKKNTTIPNKKLPQKKKDKVSLCHQFVLISHVLRSGKVCFWEYPFPKDPITFSDDDWGVYSPPKRKVFRFHYHSQFRWTRIPIGLISLPSISNWTDEEILTNQQAANVQSMRCGKWRIVPCLEGSPSFMRFPVTMVSPAR